MESVHSLIARSNLAVRDLTDGSSNSVINAMIALLTLVFIGLMLVAILVVLRRMKRQQQMRDEMLPQYNDIKHEYKRNGNHRRLTIQTANGHSSVLVFQDGSPMLANPNSPPHSPDNVPEIHITFPEEQDERGRPKSGRVLVVRVGDNSTVGLEPVHDEQLPAYEKESSSQFYSIDMDRIGGLREKDRKDFY